MTETKWPVAQAARPCVSCSGAAGKWAVAATGKTGPVQASEQGLCAEATCPLCALTRRGTHHPLCAPEPGVQPLGHWTQNPPSPSPATPPGNLVDIVHMELKQKTKKQPKDTQSYNHSTSLLCKA